jgi:hypothetical protein
MSKKNDHLQLGKANYLILLLAAVLLIVGYIVMSFNEIVISPLILAAVYVVIIPFALLYKAKPKE